MKRALDSIYNQSYRKFEVIVVDDCSEEPLDVSNYELSYIRNTENMGPGASRNIGFEKTIGDYIVFLDCDDYWEPHFLDVMVATLEKSPDVIMAYCNGYNINTEDQIIEKRAIGPHTVDVILPDLLIYGRQWVTGGCVWVRDKIKATKWIPNRVWEDYAFDTSQAIVCNKVLKVDDHLIYYEVSGTNKLSNRNLATVMKDKNGSLNYMAVCLANSSFYTDLVIRKAIIKLLISNTIDLIRLDIKDHECISKNINALKQYHSLFFAKVISICTLLPNTIGLYLLRRLRKHFNFK